MMTGNVYMRALKQVGFSHYGLLPTSLSNYHHYIPIIYFQMESLILLLTFMKIFVHFVIILSLLSHSFDIYYESQQKFMVIGTPLF